MKKTATGEFKMTMSFGSFGKGLRQRVLTTSKRESLTDRIRLRKSLGFAALLMFAGMFFSTGAFAAINSMTCSGKTGSVTVPLTATGISNGVYFDISNCDGEQVVQFTPFGLYPTPLGFDTQTGTVGNNIIDHANGPSDPVNYQTVTGSAGGTYALFWNTDFVLNTETGDGYNIYMLSPPTSGSADSITLTYITPANSCAVSGISCDPGSNPFTDGTVTIIINSLPALGPTVTAINPVSGPTVGGTSVTLTGTGFTGATGVTIGGTVATSVTVVNSTTITAVTPAQSAGTASVLVTTPGGTNTANTLYTYVAPPTVSAISPGSGTTAGGTSVTITGTGFTGATGVTIGGTAATSVTVVNSTTITAVTPAKSAGTASVLVTTAGGTNAANSLYTYASPPTVTAISPGSGTTAGGTSVTITGTGFTGATGVTIGGTAATGVTVVSATSITATTPAGSAGTASVLVTTPGGTNTANTLYTYIASPTVTGISPSSGTTAGGTSVTITGTGFTGTTAVTIGGISATGVTVVSATSITATTTARSAGTASVLVTTTGGTNAANSLYTYIASPTVTGILPALGIGSGGTDVTITGTFFTPASTVTFGAASATSVTYISPTALTAVAPAGTGVVDVTVTSAGGTSATSGADQFTYLAQVAALTNPLGVAVDENNNLYVADSGLSYIVKVPAGCATLSCETIAGSGLNNLTGVAVDGNGNLYALSGGGSGTVTRLPWNAVTGNYGAQSTVATGLVLPSTSPTGIAVDAAGNLYFTDTANKRVVELPWIANASTYGAQIALYTGSGSSAPSGVAVDASGNLYVTDGGTQTLTQIKPSGEQTTLATAINAQSVAVDGSGEVYYSDSVANTVTRLPWNGSAFGAPVIMVSALSVPYGVAVDDEGNILVANNTSKSILKATVTVPPSLSFASTRVDATSADSPQSATLANIGNRPLSFPPVSGINPTISTGFTLANSATCPQVFSTSASQSLAQGASCKYAVNFSPTNTNVGANNGTLVATNTNLNAAAATQTIALSGTGIADDVSTVTLTLNPVSPVVFGKAVAITAVVKDTTNTATIPTGSVGFTSTNNASVVTTINPSVALSGGSAMVSSFTPPTVGTYTITGDYTGSIGNIAASSGTASLTVTKFRPELAYTPSTTTQIYSTPITAAALNATAVDVNGVAIPGTFVYTTTANSVVTTLVAGTTVLPISGYTISATFSPTDTTNYVSGGTITASYAVTQATATVTLGNLSQTYMATAHTATAVTVPANLNVSFTYNGSSAPPITAGSYTVIASVNDANYTGTATGTLVIAKASPSVVLLSSGVNPVLLTATVSSSFSMPTGAVTFLDGTSPLGIGTIASGVATLSTTALAVGSHTLTAAYQGDSNFLPLSSPALTQSVTQSGLDFTLNVAASEGSVKSVTVVPGGTATYQITVSPLGAATFPAAVTLTAGGLPAGATYTISPSTIAAGAGVTNIILTITVPQAVAQLERNAPKAGSRAAPFALALLLLPFAGRIRRARKHLGRVIAVFFLLMAGLGATSLIGCGSGSGFLGQQQKSYAVAVTGTSGALTHSTTVELTVE